MYLRLLVALLCVCWYSHVEAQPAEEAVYLQYAEEYRSAMSALSRGNPIWCHGFNSMPMGTQFFIADGGVIRESTPWSHYSSYYRDFIGQLNTLTHLERLHRASGYPKIDIEAEFSAGSSYWSNNCMGSEQSFQETCEPIGDLCTKLISETNGLVITIYGRR